LELVALPLSKRKVTQRPVADRLVRLVMIISAAIASVVIVGVATGAAALNSPAGAAARSVRGYPTSAMTCGGQREALPA